MPDALIVVTEEGYWGEELLEPLEGFDDVGVHVDVATPSGAIPFPDPRSEDPNEVGALKAQKVEELEEDPRLDEPLTLHSAEAEGYDAVVFPGGHGTVWDINVDTDAQRLLLDALDESRTKAMVVCHAVGLLAFAKTSDGTPVAEGREVTGFPNNWEDDIVDEDECLPDGSKLPYRVEDVVKEAGAKWDAQLGQDTSVKVDGDLVTVRGPASSEEGIQTLLDEMGIDTGDE